MSATMRVCVAALAVLLIGAASAQEANNVKGALAAQAAALEQARKEQVDVLAPKSFAEAASIYEQAGKDAEKNRKPDKVRAALATSERALANARKAAEVARTALATVLKTRDDAVAAQAPQFAAEAWRKGAERFADAALKVERGDVSGGQKRAAEADVLLRDAELAGVKGAILGEARALIAQAEQAEVADYAPRTLAEAKKYLLEGEQEIVRSRYDVAAPRALAQQAAYEARHALYLASAIRSLQEKKKKDFALEEMLLSWEESLKQMAMELELDANFDGGYAPPLQTFIESIGKLQRDLRSLRQDVADRDAQIGIHKRELKRIEDKLGGVSEERVTLQRRLDAQAQQRANIAQIENSFAPSEARVYRQGESLVISLTGVTFPVGKSAIDPASFGLLSKVHDAIKLFPNTSLIVEGHTDSDGSDSANLILSQDRADAVKQYLVSNAGVNPEKISSIGYGSARPVASNQNAEGKARNRRIDLVMQITGAL